MFAELGLVLLFLLGLPLLVLVWEAWDDRRVEASIHRQLAEQEAQR
jgi:hypothetical protein